MSNIRFLNTSDFLEFGYRMCSGMNFNLQIGCSKLRISMTKSIRVDRWWHANLAASYCELLGVLSCALIFPAADGWCKAKSCCCQNLIFFSHQHQHYSCLRLVGAWFCWFCQAIPFDKKFKDHFFFASRIVRLRCQVSMPAWNASIVSQAAADCVAAVQALRSTQIRRIALALKPELRTRFHKLHLEFGEFRNSFILKSSVFSTPFFRVSPFTFQISNYTYIMWPCHFPLFLLFLLGHNVLTMCIFGEP